MLRRERSLLVKVTLKRSVIRPGTVQAVACVVGGKLKRCGIPMFNRNVRVAVADAVANLGAHLKYPNASGGSGRRRR